MALRVRTVVPLTLAVAAVFMLVASQLANAAHVRPKSASPFVVSLVPAFNACTAAQPAARPAVGVPVV